MKSILYISILESIYLLYIFRYFKTTINFDIRKIYFSNTYLHHNVTNQYGFKICPFGRDFILVLIGILLFRNVYKIPQTYIYYSLYIALGLSFILNWNAVIYLLPVYLLEKYIH